jgi:hypothetical protein
MEVLMPKFKLVVLGVYFSVFIFLAIIMLIATQLNPSAQIAVLATTGEAFKIVVSAFVGALSAMLGSSK